MKKTNFDIFELCSIVVTAISIFLPFIRVSILGSTVSVALIDSYGGKHVGIVFLIICGFALIACFFQKHLIIVFLSIIISTYGAYYAYSFNTLYYAYDNSIYQTIAKNVFTLGAGFYLFLIGSILMIVSAIYAIINQKREKSKPISFNMQNDFINDNFSNDTIMIDKNFIQPSESIPSNINKNITQTSYNDKTATLLKRLKIFIEDGDFESANQYCERILDIDPESGECYKYRLFIEHKVKNISELKQYVLNGNKINKKLLNRAINFGASDLTIFDFLDYKSDLWLNISDNDYQPLNPKSVLSINSTDKNEIKNILEEYTKEIIYAYNSSLPYTASKISNLLVIKNYKDTQSILDKWYEDILKIPNVGNTVWDTNFELKKSLISAFSTVKNVKNDLDSINDAEITFNREKETILNNQRNENIKKLKKYLPFITIFAILLIIITIFIVHRMNAGKIKFEKVNGGIKYKLENGSYATGWCEIKGNEYYFDPSGFLQTNTWVNDKYYVDENGKKQKNYWLSYQSNMYYLGEDGEYYGDGIYDINGNLFSFTKNGALETNKIVKDKNNSTLKIADEKGFIITNEQSYEFNQKEYYIKSGGNLAQNEWVNVNGIDKYFDNNGERVIYNFAIAKGYTSATLSNIIRWCYIDGTGDTVKNEWIDCSSIQPNFLKKWCYADKDGLLLQNKWFSYQGDDYYFDENCYMVTNSFVPGSFYVDENGKKIKNTQRVISGKTYTFDASGKSNIKTENDKWRIDTYSDTNENFITNKNYFSTEYWYDDERDDYSYCHTQLFVDKSYIGFRIKHRKASKFIQSYTKVKISIHNSTNVLHPTTYISSEPIGQLNGKSLILSEKQKNSLLNLLQSDGNRITIHISDDEGDYGVTHYVFTIDSTGFNELYSSL